MSASQIEQALVLAVEHAKRWPEEDLGDLEFHHKETLPEGGYAMDNRHREEDGWFHFATTYSYRLGATTYISVKPESGEVRSSTIGE